MQKHRLVHRLVHIIGYGKGNIQLRRPLAAHFRSRQEPESSEEVLGWANSLLYIRGNIDDATQED